MGVYKIKGSPHYWYDFSLKGVRFRASAKTDNRADALAIEAAERRRVLLGEHYKTQGQLTLTEAFGRYWMERVRFNKAQDSVKAHIAHIMAHFGEGKMLHDIGQADLASYVAKSRGECLQKTIYSPKERKISKRPSSKPVSPSTINRRLTTFQGMHNEARLSWGVQVQNINFKKLKLKEPPPVNNTMTPETLGKWLDKAPPHIRHFTMLAVFSGLRMTNILTLRGSQIDIDRGIIQTVGKGGKAITVTIVDELLHYIAAHELHKQDYAVTYRGAPVKTIRTAWKNLCDELKIAKFRRHDMRHTCATWIYEKTGDLLAVKEHLHHADLKTSLRYTHTNKDAQREKLNRALSPGFKQVKIAKN